MFLTITCTLQNPIIAANLTSLVQNQLTRYIVNYRTEKVRKEMEFLISRQSEAKKDTIRPYLLFQITKIKIEIDF